MAAPMPRGLSYLFKAVGWWSRQPVLASHPIVVVPVRTKKRFTPPAYEPKFRTEKEFAEHARKAGLVIPPERLERPIHLACTANIFEAYVPPEGDARMSSLSKEGLTQRTERLKKNVASQLSIRKIKEYDADFKVKDFPEKAKDIFIEAHLCLNNSDHDRLHTLVTEHCFPALAIYDRFGRLMYGEEDVPKDVLEYVVFEKHLANPYGSWRMHGKIVPTWAPPKQPIIKTVMIPGPELKPGENYEEARGGP
ncbi:39S ribosomal protein L45, mitochondrial isoform X2 [Ochotona curzoniae]|uniref:39S ribosomal protein L45, mitochondrial isoform X2 n=1 Tax=Ochotona curzoniae TaxID=130825 RepID=UPI001B351AC1|nr:39S ribosomal protein L45, mitochondrial isoform X2 [Ochotona curzoniae]